MILLCTLIAFALAAQQAASITGRVVDDRGTPLAGASVVVAGGPAPAVHPVLTTDDGSFSIAGLEPAVYTITVAKAGFPVIEHGQTSQGSRGVPIRLTAGQKLDLPLRLPRGAAISGRMIDDSGNPAVGQRLAVARTGQTGWRVLTLVHMTTTAAGDFRIWGLPAGTYRVAAVSRNVLNDAVLSAESTSVTLSPGDEREGVVLRAAAPVKSSSVTLVPVGGTPEQLRYPRTELRRPGEERAPISFGRRNPDGSITFDNVAAGSYRAMISAGPLWGFSDITVDGEHAATISIPMAPGRRVQGRVTFDGTAPPPARVSVHLIAADLNGIVTGEIGTMSQVTRDGTFTLTGVPPGHFVLRIVGGAPDATWSLAAATHDDRDIVDAPLAIGEADLTGVLVTLTDRKTSVRGTVRFASGAPANERFVVFYPADASQRTRNSRRVDAAVTNIDGEYELKGLPAGRYAIAVLDEMDREALRTPDALAKLTPIAFATLTLGETTTHTIVVR